MSAFSELSLGIVWLLIKILIFAGLAVALADIGLFVFGGSADKLLPYNNLIGVCTLLVLITDVSRRVAIECDKAAILAPFL